MKRRLKVLKESKTGRNEKFQDTKTNEEITRSEAVRRIKKGVYDGYHIRVLYGVETPVSNPDKEGNNNLDE